jgi:magnesium-protoporphyrin IX monomethyl ester (oxidative) cyclase
MFETSRGCWWGERAHCTFCGLNGGAMSYRAMKPDQAVALIESLVRRYGHKAAHLESADNILPREYLSEVLPRLNLPPNLTMFYEVKADLKEQDVKVLAEAGVRRIQPGIESIATQTLKSMRKGTTAFQNIRLLMNCLRYGVRPSWNLLVGFPNDDASHVYETYLECLPTLFHLPPPRGVGRVRFDRFSPYFVNADRFGLDLEPVDYYRMCFPFDEASLFDLAYYFSDRTPRPKYKTDLENVFPRLRDIVKSWRKRWLETGLSRTRPELSIVRDAARTIVRDTRLDQAKEHVLSETECSLLHDLRTPQATTDARFDREGLQLLQDKGLVFVERGKAMSLMPSSRDDVH